MAKLDKFPKKIRFVSDDTVAVLESESKTAGVYLYTKALYFKGKTVMLSLEQIERLHSSQRIEILKT